MGKSKTKGGRVIYQTIEYKPSDSTPPPLPPRSQPQSASEAPPPPPPPRQQDVDKSQSLAPTPPQFVVDEQVIQDVLARLRKPEPIEPVHETTIADLLEESHRRLKPTETVERTIWDMLGNGYRRKKKKRHCDDWMGGYVIIPKQRKHPFLKKGSKEARIYMALVRSFKH